MKKEGLIQPVTLFLKGSREPKANIQRIKEGVLREKMTGGQIGPHVRQYMAHIFTVDNLKETHMEEQ